MGGITDLLKDKITIEKPNGQTFECEKASVQSKKVFIWCGDIPLEEDDIIIQKIDNGTERKLIVTNRGYYNDSHFGPHFQAEVEPLSNKIKNESKINDMSINGKNIQVNINSNNNIMNIPFDEIRSKINEIEDPSIRKDALKCVDEIEESSDEKTKLEKFSELIEKLSPYAPVICSILSIFNPFG